jgi:spermidine/putrescine transport system substrate-binding protein
MPRAQSPREPLPGAAAPRPPLSRRRFLQRAGLGAAGMAVAGPALLAACTASGAASRLRTVRVVNEPLEIDDNTPKLFERATGIFLQYTEYTDPDEYLRSISAGLQAHRDIGADVVIVPDALTAKMIASGWARPLDLVAARGRAMPQFANPAFDPGRKYSLPYASTMVGLAYDRRRVTEPIRSVGALFDPRFAGKVALSADAASTLGLVTAALGLKPAAVTPSQA